MINVLVTGGSGMVGKCMQEYLEFNEPSHRYTFISSKEYDLTDIIQVEECFKERKYDRIIHLAAVVGGLYENMNNNCEMLIKNNKINMNVLEMCHKYNVNRGIFCLSSCIYPKNPSKFPMTEEQLCESEPHESNEGYAYAKRMLYLMCKHYNKQYGREYICVSPVNLYGFYDNFNIKSGHVIPGLINRMYKTKHGITPYDKKVFEVYGTGEAMRQFLFAPDFVYIILQILNNVNITDGLYNICDENEYKIKEVVDILSELFEFDKSLIHYNTNYSDGILKKTVSNSKLLEILPTIKFIPLKGGLKYTYDWFVENVNNIRE